MNESYDELRAIWSSPGAPSMDVDRIVRDVQQKSNEFKRMITFRDWREMAGGALVAVIFLAFAAAAGDSFVRAGHLWTAASGLWIAFYIRRYSLLRRDPPRNQPSSAYRQALLDSYTRQIALLKTVKYWYLLPLWLGLTGVALAQWRSGGNWTACLVSIAVPTVIFAFLWWLNESPGVRYLQRKQAELASLIQALEEREG